MKHDTLMSFGCSHMYGWEHLSTENNTKPSADVYTNLLAKEYNLKHFNFSEGGASNQSILRQVIFGQQFEKDNNLNSIYWIQWSGYERLEIPWLDSSTHCKNWPYVNVDGEIKNDSNSFYLKKWANSLYKNLDNLALFILSCNSIIQVNSLLKSQNKKVINTFANTWDTKCAQKNYYIKDKNLKNLDTMYTEILYNDFLKNKIENLDKSFANENIFVGKSGTNYKNFDPYTKRLWSLVQSFEWFCWDDDKELGFKPWGIKQGFKTYPNRHLNEQAHKEAFVYICNSSILKE